MMYFGGTGVEGGEDGVNMSQVRMSTGHEIVNTTGHTLIQSLIHRFLIGIKRKKLYFGIKRCEHKFRV